MTIVERVQAWRTWRRLRSELTGPDKIARGAAFWDDAFVHAVVRDRVLRNAWGANWYDLIPTFREVRRRGPLYEASHYWTGGYGVAIGGNVR